MSVFGRVFGAIFGQIFGSIGATSVDTEEAGLAKIAAGAVNRLAEQFKSKLRITDLMTALSEPAQAVEDALQQLLTKRGVYDAVGAQLDRLGVIVGQPRAGYDDTAYRRFLLTRVAINRSRGRTPDLIGVARLALGSAPTAISVQPEQVATAVVAVLGDVPGQDLANVLFAFLDQARAAGVRLILETLTALEDSSLTTGLASFVDGALATGATEIPVDDTSGFPASGTLDLDSGTAVAEQVTYAGKLADRFLGVSATAHDHDDGACALLADDGDTGFAVVAITTTSTTAGATALVVDTTSGFAASGSVDVFANGEIDAEAASPLETLAYTSIDATHFNGLVTGANHAADVIVRPHSGTRGGHLVTAQDRVL